MTPMYYRKSDIVFICVDLTSSCIETSFNYWITALRQYTDIDNQIIYLVGTKLIYVIYNGKYLLRFRRLMIRLYSAYFGIGNDHFSLSEKTINCLVNKGSSKSVEAFKLIYKLEKKIKNKIRLENVLVEDIE